MFVCSKIESKKRSTYVYFYASFFAYVLGLGLTIFVMHVFKHAQASCTLYYCVLKIVT